MKQCKTIGCDGSSGFGSNKASKDGLSRTCRDCNNKRAREYRDKHPDVERNAQRMYREKNAKKTREYNRLYMQKRRAEQKANGITKTPEQLRRQKDYALRWKYGITIDQFEAMEKEQAGECKICKSTTRELFVDHCHESGIVRGLLCTQCNTAAGLIADSPEIASNMAEYLRVAKLAIEQKQKEQEEFNESESVSMF